jgi:hypothetical protein
MHPRRTEQNRTEQNRTEQNRTEQNRTEQNRTEQNRTEQNRTEQSSNLLRERQQDHFVTSIVATPRRQFGVRRIENCARRIFLVCEGRIGLFSIFSEIENSGISSFGEHLRTSRLPCGKRRLLRGGIRSLVSGAGLLTIFGPRVRSKCPINFEVLCPSFDQGNRSRGGGSEVSVASGVEDRLGNLASVQERCGCARVGSIVWISSATFLFPRLGARFETRVFNFRWLRSFPIESRWFCSVSQPQKRCNSYHCAAAIPDASAELHLSFAQRSPRRRAWCISRTRSGAF